MNVQGLAGITAGDTAISTVGKAGVGLTYRGYEIHDLAEHSTFEAVAYLLVYGEYPTPEQLKKYQEKLVTLRNLPEKIVTLLNNIPESANPMDVLRTGVSLLGTLEPETSATMDKLVAVMPVILLSWFKKQEIKNSQTSTADYFLEGLLGKKPDLVFARALDISLILYAEHEFNASTFAARVTAATLSDVYSCITTGIGTLRGPLHGGANEEAMKLIQLFSDPDEAEKGLKKMLAEKKLIMGFGHRVYSKEDPRSPIVKKLSSELAEKVHQQKLFLIAERIEKVMWDEKKLFPNLDFYSATAYHFCGIPTLLFTPIFAMSRLSGWSAHIFEQRENNRLIRPEGAYIGPAARPFPPIETRG